MTSGMNNEAQLFVISSDHIADCDIMDDINTLLTTADLPDLYSVDEKSSISNKMMEIAHEQVIFNFFWNLEFILLSSRKY